MIDEKRNATDTSQEKKIKRSEKSEHTKVDTQENQRFIQLRLIPIWLRIVLVLILLFFATIIGTMIGYGGIGDGEPLDALKWGTWRHIFDIINGKV